MSTYVIVYSDPLRNSFQITPGGFNGPGGAVASSPLRLYGRGALEWGEAVDENMLRMLENWNGATPPPFAVAGQFWFQTKFYWLQTATNWYRYDPDVVNTWTILTVTGTTAGTNTAPVSPSDGDYWYTGGAPSGNDAFGNPLKATTLYRFDKEFSQVSDGWIERTHTTNAAAPVNGVDFPARNLLVWDEFVHTSGRQTVSFTSPITGADPSGLTNDATVYTASIVVDGTHTQPIAVTGSTAQTMTTVASQVQADLGGFATCAVSGGKLVVTSLSIGTTSTIAITDTDLFSSLTNFSAIDTAVVGTNDAFVSPPSSIAAAPTPTVGPAGSFWWDTTNNRLYVSNGITWDGVILASGTVPMVANLDLGANDVINLSVQTYPDVVNTEYAASKAYVNDAVSLTNLTTTLDGTYVNVSGDTMTGDLVLYVGAPATTASATPKSYVTANFAQVFSAANNTTSVAHKPGDIYVDTVGPIIYIAVTSATSAPTNTTDWKQVWPAQYS